MRPASIIILIITLTFISCTKQQEGQMTGDYLGQELPGEEPEVFASGIISKGMFERDMAISPDGDEIYYSVIMGRFDYTMIMVVKRENGVWGEPEVAEFSGNPKWKDLEPFISPDGKRFFFMSNRPDTTNGETEPGDEDIWVMDRTGSVWSAPYNLGEPVSSDKEEYFPSVTKDGTIYFTRQEKGSPIGHIYRSRLINGEYTEPEKLPEEVNSGQAQYNAFIAPDESYIIVPTYGREDSGGGTDYYISFRNENDEWTGPFNMGDKINSESNSEYSAYVSPDGKFIFFMSDRKKPLSELPGKFDGEYLEGFHNSSQNGYPDIYWMRADFIDELR
jgi:hypothetical protein